MARAAELKFTGIRKINLLVARLDESVEFYRDFLGFQDVEETVATPREAICRSGHRLNDDHFAIVLTENLTESESPGLYGVTVEVGSVREMVDLHERANKQGIPATELCQQDGCWRTTVSDPDGYEIELITRDSGGGERVPLSE